MPILEAGILAAQQRGVEIGRIRLGAKVATANGGARPSKLAQFRLTSPNKSAIEAAADVLGGEAREWKAPTGPQWEVYTTSDTLDVVVPPGEAIEQWFERWSGGGCLRRCTGAGGTDQITGNPCDCPIDPQQRAKQAATGGACKPTSRLRVILPTLPGIGVWRVESHGYYAAVELVGRHTLLRSASEQGVYVPARLRLEQRQRGKNQYGVPVLDIGVSVAQIAAGEGVGALPAVVAAKAPLALEAAGRPALPAASSEVPTPQIRKEDVPPAERAAKYAAAALGTTDLGKIREYAGHAGKAGLLEEFVTIDPDEPMVMLKDFLAQRLEALSGAEVPA